MVASGGSSRGYTNEVAAAVRLHADGGWAMSETAIKLRDKRKPGHCWQDNELYDCFQPVIGPLAVNVYVRITRECYGTTVKIGVRELAELTGISKSAVHRALAVLEAVGLVRAKRAAVKQAAEYDLADLKELAVRHGAVFDAGRFSYVLPREAREKLRLDVKHLRGRMHGESVPLGDSADAVVEDASVPQMRESVPVGGQYCPPNAENLGVQQNSKKARNKKNSPLPPSPGGEMRDAGMRAGWDGVLKDLHEVLVNPSLPAGVNAALRGDEDWARYFAEMSCDGVDRRIGDVGALVLRVPNAAIAQQGLVKYRKRILAGMQKYFGCDVPVTLVDSS